MITAARCLALAFIYSVFAGTKGGLASLLICWSRLVFEAAVTVRCRFWSKAQSFNARTRRRKEFSATDGHGRSPGFG